MAWLRNKKTGGWFEIPDEKLDTNKYMNDFIKQKGKEEVSLSRAKQRFKDNILKYGLGTSFEDSILYYNLRKEEIESLYKYAQKTNSYKKDRFKEIDRMYEKYKNGIDKVEEVY